MLSGSYCGSPPDAATWLARWNLDPVLLACLGIAFLMAMRLPPGRRAAGLGAVGAAAIVFVSPLCALSVALFAARSAHHLLLVALVAPLAAVAWPARWTIGVTPALGIAAASLWAWHLPALYDSALSNKAVYWVMQATLLAGAWTYWSALRAAAAAAALTGVALGAGQMGLLGAILTFAPRPLYTVHPATTAGFGIGPLADQQLGGLVMWVPGLLPYAVVAAILAARAWRGMATA